MRKEMKMEFLDEVATQMTELYFQEDTFAPSSEVGQEDVLMFTEEAQDFYNEKYDELEALYDSINNRFNKIKAINDSLKEKMLKIW